jgi:ABC-type molybdate transport system substrate-binding protein
MSLLMLAAVVFAEEAVESKKDKRGLLLGDYGSYGSYGGYGGYGGYSGYSGYVDYSAHEPKTIVKTVPVPVHVPKPYPVTVPVDRPYPVKVLTPGTLSAVSRRPPPHPIIRFIANIEELWGL